jgi:hypothetical protein
LYPHFTDAQLAEAEDTHDRYLVLVLRIFDRLQLKSTLPADQLTPATGALPCPLSDFKASI